MPKVNQNFRGPNTTPQLKVLKNERTALMNAAAVLTNMGKCVSGFQPAMAEELHKLSARLQELGEVESTDLSKPPF